MFEVKTDEIIPDEVAKVGEVDRPIFSPYEAYLKDGGLFTKEDYAELTSADEIVPTKEELAQIDSIRTFSITEPTNKIIVNPDEIELWARLRRKSLPPGTTIDGPFRPEERQSRKDLVPVPVAWMSDQRLLAEIFRAKGEYGKCDAIVKRTLPPIE